jgi:uncharacterized protein YbaR (Trm112 family)
MSFIQEQRENVIKTNNTAQQEFDNILLELRTTIIELNIQSELHGDLELSILTENNYQQINTIYFGRGELTSIRNIPSTVSKLICSGNLLIDFIDLPASLVYLDFDNNHLTKFDFTKIPRLEELHCIDNKITEFINIPTSIISLYCDQNKLKHLDLKGLKNLRTLHISNNPLIIIENLPETIHDFVSENNHISQITNERQRILEDDEDDDTDEDQIANKNKAKDISKKLKYLDALDKYFKIKNKYDEKLLKFKKAAFKTENNKKQGMKQSAKIKIACIHCKRPVGTIFSTNATNYIAVCGDTKSPCELKIKLFRGDFNLNEQYLYYFKQQLEDDKQIIITQKMDTLFNYLSENQSSELFKKNLENYNSDSNIFLERLNYHNELYHSEHRKELINRKNNIIYEIQEKINVMLKENLNTGNTEIIKTAMNIYVNDLKPEIENLRRLKYDVMEVEDDILYQNIAFPSKIEYTYGEQPSVIQFTKI